MPSPSGAGSSVRPATPLRTNEESAETVSGASWSSASGRETTRVRPAGGDDLEAAVGEERRDHEVAVSIEPDVRLDAADAERVEPKIPGIVGKFPLDAVYVRR